MMDEDRSYSTRLTVSVASPYREPSIGLGLLVKNEMNRVDACLQSVSGLVDDVFIIDTGSDDGTPQHIEDHYGIPVRHDRLEERRCFTKADLRNKAIRALGTDWVLTLDADERLEREGLPDLREVLARSDQDGYFGRWWNHTHDGACFEDYKLFLFRSSFSKRGLIHENTQVDIRERNGSAVWLEGLEVRHYPEASKSPQKKQSYRWRLERAIAMEPEWLRYYWFLGYMDYLQGRLEAAEQHLLHAATRECPLFPVERMNSWMVLVDIAARKRDAALVHERLRLATRLLEGVRDDFEIRVNHRMAGWFETAIDQLERGRMDRIRAYRFAC